MLVADARAAAWIVFLDDLAADTRLRAHQRARITAYTTKLAGEITAAREDLDMAGIIMEFIRKASKNH